MSFDSVGDLLEGMLEGVIEGCQDIRIVTRLAWIAHRLVSSNRETR